MYILDIGSKFSDKYEVENDKIVIFILLLVLKIVMFYCFIQLKKVMKWMVFVFYYFKLEIFFCMDEFVLFVSKF